MSGLMPGLKLRETVDRTDRTDVDGLIRQWLAEIAPRDPTPEPMPPSTEWRGRDERPRPLRPSFDPVEVEPIRPEDEALARLEAELAITKAALKAERERFAELRTEVDALAVLKTLLQAERERAEHLRADRDRWAARAEVLALPLFQERQALAGAQTRD